MSSSHVQKACRPLKWKVTRLIHQSDSLPAKDAYMLCSGALAKSLDNKPVKPLFNPFRGIKAGLVLGRPWLEDLYHRLPKNRLKIEFVPVTDSSTPAELSQESLYSLFRRYGKIADITSQPPDSKLLPRFAYVDFALVRDAIMARNCMHGFILQEEGSKNPTRLRLSYEQRVKPHHIWNWISSHPRIVIPIIAAFLAAFTVAVFDPIREFFVQVCAASEHTPRQIRLANSQLDACATVLRVYQQQAVQVAKAADLGHPRLSETGR